MVQDVGTTIEIKKQNRRNVLRYIFRNGTTSRQDIAQALHLSMPTALQNVKELQNLGLIQELGRYESTGGRKATVISSISDAAFSVGIDITRNHISLVLVDLAENLLYHERIICPYQNKIEYYDKLGVLVQNFIKEHPIDSKKIIGAGISIPGILNEDATVITYSHVLGMRNVSCSMISRVLPWPTFFENDANVAGLAELRLAPLHSTMVYISLSNSVGGSIFIDGKLYKGTSQRSGEFGHLRIVEGGKTCYCGQKGCADAYCSALQLTEDGRNLEVFFEKLKSGDPKSVAMWDDYLRELSQLIINVRMSFDCDIVLGGYVGEFLEPWLPELSTRVAALDPFEQPGNLYLHACHYKQESSGYGAAILPLENYINKI